MKNKCDTSQRLGRGRRRTLLQFSHTWTLDVKTRRRPRMDLPTDALAHGTGEVVVGEPEAALAGAAPTPATCEQGLIG